MAEQTTAMWKEGERKPPKPQVWESLQKCMPMKEKTDRNKKFFLCPDKESCCNEGLIDVAKVFQRVEKEEEESFFGFHARLIVRCVCAKQSRQWLSGFPLSWRVGGGRLTSWLHVKEESRSRLTDVNGCQLQQQRKVSRLFRGSLLSSVGQFLVLRENKCLSLHSYSSIKSAKPFSIHFSASATPLFPGRDLPPSFIQQIRG